MEPYAVDLHRWSGSYAFLPLNRAFRIDKFTGWENEKKVLDSVETHIYTKQGNFLGNLGHQCTGEIMAILQRSGNIISLSTILWMATLTCGGSDLPSRRFPLVDFLCKYGLLNHLAFSLELTDTKGVLVDPVIDMLPVIPKESTSEPVYLQEHLPDFAILRSSFDESIYYVVDKRLLTDHTYPLNQVVDKFSYQGTPVGLLDALSKYVKDIGSPTQFMVGSGPIIRDKITKVEVSADKMPAREVITKSLPKGYNVLLWKSSYVPGRNPSTKITFQGDRKWAHGPGYNDEAGSLSQ